MKYQSNWLSDLQETSEELLQDTLLLEAMALRMEQREAYTTNVPPEILEQTRRRVLDYLAQHTMDLYFLSQRPDRV